MNRYFAFYTEAVGNRQERKVFDDEDAMLNLVLRSNKPESTIRGLVVIFGEKLDFEPHEKVTAWRIKEVSR